MSLYGYERPTTPRLDEWARHARVYENCVSTAAWTVPSHASMLTGLLPSEHGTDHDQPILSHGYTTVTELFQAAGYQTYLYAANPHVSSASNFQQGFDLEEHPWDEHNYSEAVRIVREKLLPADNSALARSVREGTAKDWTIKACGELAQAAVHRWLKTTSPARPYFIFLNYMEAHEPYCPPESHRLRMMSPRQVKQSCRLGPVWPRIWYHTFGLRLIEENELQLQARLYDATLAELDDLFMNLIDSLAAEGHLNNTIVVLTADHGEHLGEHRLLNHQYSLYQPLIRVPLVLFYPPAVTPGRVSSPVMNFDIFPTLMELCGIDAPGVQGLQAKSLLHPREDRLRLAEYPSVFEPAFRAVKKGYPDWDPTPWKRTLRSIVRGNDKFIWSSDGRHELYDLSRDPLEETNLVERESQNAAQLAAALEQMLSSLALPLPADVPKNSTSDAHQKRLKALGYADSDESPDSGSGDDDP